MELWILCEHDEAQRHRVIIDKVTNWFCPGGHAATVEEVIGWLAERGECDQIRVGP